jgi:ATP-dependent DNA helicase RecG
MASPARSHKPLDTEIQYLKGVGPRNAGMLAKLGIATVRDMLFYFPRRYEDRTKLPSMAEVRPGQTVTVRGRFLGVEGRPIRGGKVVIKAAISDGTSTIALVWFNQPWVRRRFEDYEGEVVAYGTIKESGYAYQIQNPEYELLGEEEESDFARIAPVYALSEGVPQWVVRKAAAAAVTHMLDGVEDPLPEALLRTHGLKPLRWAIAQTHSPSSEDARREARKRLVFDEFFALQVALAIRRQKTQQEVGIAFPISQLGAGEFAGGGLLGESRGASLEEELHSLLPFELTGAQKRVIGEIWSDMERPYPMNRLLQGDVGSGKTAVAAAAMLAAVRSGYQAALMAPTEILAEQHYVSLRRLFDPIGLNVELLVGKLTPTQKKKAATSAREGVAQIAIGTHALIQEGVEFRNLGLVVIDEQHRFGVLQRAALRGKGIGNPDVLVMTATPIPRTLTMTLYGDLDLSVLDEMPPGRKPIKTHWKQPNERPSVYEGIRKLVQAGRQAYVVCPLIQESEQLTAQAAEDLYYRMKNVLLADVRVGLLHGQMKPKEKEEVMDAFRRNELEVLVSTTVIEVGVDVANATAMVIEDANRFGLSQLHQLRGRVGRGANQSFCVLVGEAANEEARARMEIMVQTTDGFKIAEEDLRIRGPGELMGTKQAGMLELRMADLIQDSRMLEVARQAALELIEQDPDLTHPEHQAILEMAKEKWSLEASAAIS